MEILTAEDMSIKTLSDLAVAEVEVKLNLKMEDLDSEGRFKSAYKGRQTHIAILLIASGTVFNTTSKQTRQTY